MRERMDQIHGIKLDFQYTRRAGTEEAERARQSLISRTGAGREFLGWLDLPETMGSGSIAAIQDAANRIRATDALIVIGIGGSYLGARAVIQALRGPYDDAFPIHFAGHQLDALYHSSLLAHLKNRRYSVDVISKSGTTTEPGIAFRMFWNDLNSRYDRETVRELIIATTDEKKGALRNLCNRQGLRSFTIPDDVGGRYSVLTAVGLLPIAAAGCNIAELIRGAREMRAHLFAAGGEENPAVLYAAWRNSLYRDGKKIEILASGLAELSYFAEWWKQLYGESEGKNGKGIFPASVNYTTDLHSLGQMIQAGERSLFETILDVSSILSLPIPSGEDDDGLTYLTGRDMHDVNRAALTATMQAHSEGGVPSLRIEVPRLDEYNLGALIYFFEFACAISAYQLNVNPFDQPGVEAYKSNMFRLLGKPV
jgi:glucose-6-phosphate isomerase